MYDVLELLGTVAFAVSGAMTGIRAKMDLLGICVLGLTTAVGGGIVRDVLIGVTPPTAFLAPGYALLAIAVSLFVFIPAVRRHIDTDSLLLTLVDAIGLGVFTVVGVRTGVPYGGVFLQVFLGTVTGVGGGVMRDIFAMQKPMIFVRHFYAVAAIIGALLCSLLIPYGEQLAATVTVAVVVTLRMFAAHFHWNLPHA